MKTTQKEAIAMEKEITEILFFDWDKRDDTNKEVVNKLTTLFTSQLSQIKEEIEKVIDKTLNDFDAKVLKKEIEIFMEEKGQEK